MNKQDIQTAINRLSDPYWRINNLYSIIDKHGRKVKFQLNWAQEQLYREMWYCNVILKARQLGISTFICLLFLDRCLFNDNKAAGVIAHTREDAEYLFKRIKYAYDNLPKELKDIKKSTVDSARELVFSNGSSFRVGTSMRGSTLQYLHISEFGKICAKFPDKAQEIITGSLNTLAPGQYVFMESTAEGREGYFYDICQQAKALQDESKNLSKLEFRFHFFPWWKEQAYRIGSPITMSQEVLDYFDSLEIQGIKLEAEQKWWYGARQATQGEDMLREFPSTPEEAWEQSTEGTYYAKQISYARKENRMCFLPYDDTIPVHTAWDLGYNDSTAIWFFQIAHKEIHVLEYIEGSGESLAHWLGVVKSKPYTYGHHLAPHDILVHEYSTGMTRQASARKLGINLVPVPKVDVIPGIDAVRSLLGRCWFDNERCASGIKCLENYRKEWDDRHSCWRSKPLHNFASHGADAFRTLATGLDLVNPIKVDEGARLIGPRPGSFYPGGKSVFG